MTEDIDLTLTPQVPWGRWMLVELEPGLDPSRVRALQLHVLYGAPRARRGHQPN